jgi:hypothetical protein
MHIHMRCTIRSDQLCVAWNNNKFRWLNYKVILTTLAKMSYNLAKLMIDWVIDPQLATALYIYKVGKSYATENQFIIQDLPRLPNSNRTQGDAI